MENTKKITVDISANNQQLIEQLQQQYFQKTNSKLTYSEIINKLLQCFLGCDEETKSILFQQLKYELEYITNSDIDNTQFKQTTFERINNLNMFIDLLSWKLTKTKDT